jgi:dimethylamine/trimethylamine dehydrogenase
MTNVDMFLGSPVGVDEIIELAPDRVVVATGARWTRMLYTSIEIPAGQLDHPQVFTPDDIAAGRLPEGPTLLFDFDNYYMGGVLTEYLASQGIQVSYATPAGHASAWTIMTNELPLVHRALAKRQIPVSTLQLLSAFDGEAVILKHLFTGEEKRIACRSVVIVGLRVPRGELVSGLEDRAADVAAAGIRCIERAGDALAPGAIVHAVHSGHRVAREIDIAEGGTPYRRDFPIVGPLKLEAQPVEAGPRERLAVNDRVDA